VPFMQFQQSGRIFQRDYDASLRGQESEQTRRMGICEDFSLLRLRLCAMDSSTIRIGAARCRRSEGELVARKARLRFPLCGSGEAWNCIV
jgi:hypothetical protein